MANDGLFEKRPGSHPYLLRYGLTIAPALLTVFGADLRGMIIIVGVGAILSGGVQWLLSRAGNMDYLCTTWSITRGKAQPNKKARTAQEREKQLAARRAEIISRAKREGKLTGIFFAAAGAMCILYAALFM